MDAPEERYRRLLAKLDPDEQHFVVYGHWPMPPPFSVGTPSLEPVYCSPPVILPLPGPPPLVTAPLNVEPPWPFRPEQTTGISPPAQPLARIYELGRNPGDHRGGA
jgi:hypothetical protein